MSVPIVRGVAGQLNNHADAEDHVDDRDKAHPLSPALGVVALSEIHARIVF